MGLLSGRRRGPRPILAVLALVATLPSCHRTLTPDIHPAADIPTPPANLPILKVHMQSGELFVLESWRLIDDGRRLEGTGTRYSFDREAVSKGPVDIQMGEVALFETNRPEEGTSAGSVTLGIMTVVTGGVAAYCASDPKACFGSCPTFYVAGGAADRPAAEGFSASFARVLEASDVDALPQAPSGSRRYTVTMLNEALETHAVRRVHLLAVPRPPAGRILAGVDGRFYPARWLPPATACRAPEGECLEAVVQAGGAERYSAADPVDLATREVVEIEFAATTGRVGLVLTARQTLLSTHLFYQSLAYFGSRAGEYLARLERGGPALASQATGLARALGALEVQVSEGHGPWRSIGAFDEAGPIASDVQVLPFEARGEGPLRVRLSQARGHWRLDQVALARLGTAVSPTRLAPVSVEREGVADRRAQGQLERPDVHLVTYPGDAYELTFELPRDGDELELFLESEGYYYEWMRDEWLAEEDPEMAALVLLDPAEALRRMAGPFKGHEASLEQAFWDSRFRK